MDPLPQNRVVLDAYDPVMGVVAFLTSQFHAVLGIFRQVLVALNAEGGPLARFSNIPLLCDPQIITCTIDIFFGLFMGVVTGGAIETLITRVTFALGVTPLITFLQGENRIKRFGELPCGRIGVCPVMHHMILPQPGICLVYKYIAVFKIVASHGMTAQAETGYGIDCISWIMAALAYGPHTLGVLDGLSTQGHLFPDLEPFPTLGEMAPVADHILVSGP